MNLKRLFLAAMFWGVLPASGAELVTKISNTTPNCHDGNKAVQQVCLPEGEALGS